MTNTDSFPETWCRMWSGEATLAHELVSPEGRQWAGQTSALDDVVGPTRTEKFIADYAERVGNHYQARTLVIGGDLVAYTWDATRRDGSAVTGADLNMLRDGKVVENWTVVAAARDGRADVVGSGSATREELTAAITAEATRRGVAIHREPAIDVARQTAAYLWTPAEGQPGGLDVLVLQDGAVAQTWSRTSARPFAY
jgi:hypothetical protein